MRNDLSPLCKALIALFASKTQPITISEIEAALPDAHHPALRDELQMLVRATVVRQAIRFADERLVYWLCGAIIDAFPGTLMHYPPAPAATFADIAGIPYEKETING